MTIETSRSWWIAAIALTLLFVAYGSIYISVVALAEMAKEFGIIDQVISSRKI